MDLVKHRVQITIEITFLMRVFSITKLLLIFHCTTESRAFPTVKVIKDSRIIMRWNSKCFFGKPTALFSWGGGTMFQQHIAERFVLCLTGNNNHIIEILCSSTYQWDTAYIYFFDNSLFFRTAGYSCLKRIQIYDDQVYFRNFVFLNLLHILFQTATAQNTSENLRMQCLYTSAQNRGVSSQVFYRFARETQWFNKLSCSACWEELYSFFV